MLGGDKQVVGSVMQQPVRLARAERQEMMIEGHAVILEEILRENSELPQITDAATRGRA